MINRREFLTFSSLVPLLAGSPRRLLAADASAPAEAVTLPAPPKIGGSTRIIDPAALKPARLAAASPKACRVLQFTDLHLFRVTTGEDDRTVADCARMVEAHKPDLVVISGDVWHDNPDGRGQGFLEFAVRQFEDWGVPWATCWGNHDLLGDYQLGQDTLAAAEHSVYRGAETHGDYRLEVVSGGAPGTAAVGLDVFFLNSSDQGLTAWQLGSLGKMAGVVKAARLQPTPALLFFHVPLLDYQSQLKPDTFRGVKLEPVSCYQEKGGAFPAITEPKTIRACFCGHNHTNDYLISADGVDLHYGRSTGRGGYGGDKLRKGAKLIEVDLPTGKYTATTIFADGSKQFGWRRSLSDLEACHA